MNWPNVGKIVSSVAHTVNNDVVKPVQRDVHPVMSFLSPHYPTAPPDPLSRIPLPRQILVGKQLGPKPTISQPLTSRDDALPVIAQNLQNKLAIDERATPLSEAVYAPANPQTQQVENRAASQFSWTPEFKAIANAAQPTTTTLGDNGNLKVGVKAAAEYQPGVANNQGNSRAIRLGPEYGSAPAAVTHEALHAAWFGHPDVPQKFAKAINGNLTPDIKNYLDARLSGYAAYKGKQSLDNYNKLSPNIQTEIHSYLSEYPTLYRVGANNKAIPPVPLPAPLQKYYSEFINANAVNQKRQDTGNILQTLYQLEHGYSQQDQ